MNSLYYAYLTALFLLIIGYIAGYIVGRLDLLYRTMRLFVAGLSDVVSDEPKDFFKKAAADDRPKTTKIAINDSKFVAPVKTDSLTKSNETTIGKTTTTDDDIQTSVSRLAQLKGK